MRSGLTWADLQRSPKAKGIKTVIPAEAKATSRDLEALVRDHAYYVYILASQRNGTLYVGVTNDLVRRIQEHREGLVEGFTKRYGVKTLVYFETHQEISEAIRREKQMKRWRRKWKLELIEANNPRWLDLWRDLTMAAQ